MLILILVVGVMVAGISLFVIFDLILYLEYEEHYDEWVKDNKPAGFFWTPEGATFWQGSMSRSTLASSWLTVTPAWMLDVPKARRMLFYYRLLSWISVIGWVMNVIVLFGWSSKG